MVVPFDDIGMLQQRAVVAFAVFCALAVGYLLAMLWQRCERQPTGVPVLLCLGCVAAGVLFYFPFTNDDAFIFLRYARNLIEGSGLVYNSGERVEGFTSPAWVLLVAAAGVLGRGLLWAAKTLGIALVAGAVWVCFHATSRVAGREVGFACALVLASSQLLLSWAGSGMDVALFVFFECCLIALFINESLSRWALPLTAFGVLVRPEAYLFLALYWIWSLWRSWQVRALATGRATAAVLLALAPFLLRWVYYGDLLPNTYYAKSMLTAADGIEYVAQLARYLGWPLLGVAALGTALSLRSRPWLAACLLAAVAYLIAIGGDVLSLRLGLFIVPWLVVAVAAALASVRAPMRGAGAAVLAVVLVVRSVLEMNAAMPERRSQTGPLYVLNNGRGTLEADYLAGQYLAAHAGPGDWLLTDNIGAVGYESRLPILDTYGLVTRPVASLVARGEGDRVRDLVRTAEAPWILCYYTPGPGAERWGLWGGGDITAWARERYEPVQHWLASTGYRRVLLRRRES